MDDQDWDEGFEPENTFELSREEWEERYKPIVHSQAEDAPFDGLLLEFDGKACAAALERSKTHPGTVWTYFDDRDTDNGLLIISGFLDEGDPFQAPIGYFFTELPFEGWDKDQITIYIDGPDESEDLDHAPGHC